MIKFVLPLSRFLVSNQLKALNQLRANKNQTLPLDFKQKLIDLVQQQPIEDKDEFIKAFKEFDYDFREIAAIYNNNISGRELIVDMHKKQEPQIMLDEGYSFLLRFQPTHQFQANLGYQNFAHHLTHQGMTNILQETERQDIKWAYLSIIENTFYGWYLKAVKGDDKIQQVDSLKKMYNDILKEKDYQNVIWKVFIYSQIQPLSNKILQYLYESISNVENLNNKQLLLIAFISYKTKMKLGNQKELSSLNKKFYFHINKIQNSLDLNERIYLLLICKKHFDIYNKQEMICKPIYENIRDIKNELYPEIFLLLCNHYYFAIDLKREEQFIADNIDLFLNHQNLLDILLGLMYAESQNIELLQNLFKQLYSIIITDKPSTSTQCKFYQIYFLLDLLYKLHFEVENIQQYKEIYKNAPALVNIPVFSLAFIEMSEQLHNIALQTNKNKQSNWKITKITTNNQFEIFDIDFLVEIETEKKKEQFYFDFIQKSAVIDDQRYTARQRLREKVFKNEQIIYIKYDDWFKIEDKEQWIRKMLGKQ